MELIIKDSINTKVADINALLRAISKCSDKKVLLFLDELYFEVRDGKMDCRNLIAELENVDFFIAINPWCGKFKYDFVPPESPRILARQLRGCHRNSEQIQYLIRQYTSMTGLNRNEDRIDPTTLPNGRTPLLLVKEQDVPSSEVLRFIEDGGHIDREQGITIIKEDGCDREIELWCNKDRGRRKQVSRNAMTGCEDDVIITFDTAGHEYMTRAREMLIIVVAPGSL